MVKTPTTQQGQRHGEHGLLLPLPVGRRNCNRWSVFKKLTGVLLFVLLLFSYMGSVEQ